MEELISTPLQFSSESNNLIETIMVDSYFMLVMEVIFGELGMEDLLMTLIPTGRTNLTHLELFNYSNSEIMRSSQFLIILQETPILFIMDFGIRGGLTSVVPAIFG